ncbi:MAG: methionine--tRNA ligase [Bacteroidetes bacterium]|nr:methionine--tRNA ligase [Bacteroidota bacterium]
MKSFKRHTITAALPYANGPIHLGHVAGVYLPSDIYARYLRNKGEDVLFICGSDENGMAITLRALKDGVTPQDIVDRYHPMLQSALAGLGISFDHYSRTSSSIHYETASEFFANIDAKGILEQKTTEQLYDAEYDQFLADRYVKGTCPKCGNEGAYGDQCESCGSSLSALELINPISTLSGNKPEVKTSTHWYFPLDKYENWLKEWLLEGHQEWKNNVYGQCKSWIDGGLAPRAVTRDLNWGVPVPAKGADGKVLYVWFDAPVGYISATKEWAQASGKDWEPYWKDEETRLLHFIGKDNIVFHCIFFPSMLKAHGDYILPDNVPGNEFLNLEGLKLSTSRNWAVWLHEYLEDLAGKEDVLRYVLCANMPETKDADFSWADFQARNNNELVATIGNFANRVFVLIKKYFDGKLPELGELDDYDKEVIRAINQTPDFMADSLDQFKFKEALNHWMNLARAGNKYLADTEPWKLIKTDETRVKTILHLAAQLVANLAILSEPFLPFFAKKVGNTTGVDVKDWNAAGSHELISSGKEIENPGHLFEKIDDAIVEIQRKKLEENKASNQPVHEQLKPEIQFDDFTKLDIRVGTIEAAEKVAKTKKLLKLTVDMGFEKRTIVSGIAEFFKPEDIIGQQVSVLVNLAPRKLKGIESQGMVLMAEDAEKGLVFVQPSQVIQSGAIVS